MRIRWALHGRGGGQLGRAAGGDDAAGRGLVLVLVLARPATDRSKWSLVAAPLRGGGAALWSAALVSALRGWLGRQEWCFRLIRLIDHQVGDGSGIGSCRGCVDEISCRAFRAESYCGKLGFIRTIEEPLERCLV